MTNFSAKSDYNNDKEFSIPFISPDVSDVERFKDWTRE